MKISLLDKILAARAVKKLQRAHEEAYPLAKDFYQQNGIEFEAPAYQIKLNKKYVMEAGVKVHASLFGINRLEDLTPILLHEFSHLAHEDWYNGAISVTEVPYTKYKHVQTIELRADLESATILSSVDRVINAYLTLSYSRGYTEKLEQDVTDKKALYLAKIIEERSSNHLKRVQKHHPNYPSVGDRIRSLIKSKEKPSMLEDLNKQEETWRNMPIDFEAILRL